MIRLTSVVKKYNPNKQTEVCALRGVDFSVNTGDFIAITGPSGSGKSTLLHILAGLDEPTSGAYYFNGRDVSKMNDHQKCMLRNKEIAIILQQFGLIGSETVINNVCLPHVIGGTYQAGKTKECAREIMAQIGILDIQNKPVNQLSGGQKQRVAIARALLMGANVLLADEPTGALDAANTDSLVSLLSELNRTGLTIIIVTHNADVASKCPIQYSLISGELIRIR